MTVRMLGIVADDLTGAMDSSGYFARLGFSTIVILDAGFSSAADVVVVNTNSRADDVNKAGEKVRQAARSLAGRVVFKKIDSTLRGNIGAELEAVVEELACEKAIVAPSFPEVGRTTVNGILLVNGAKVTETQFANDPISPVKISHIPALLAKSTGRRIGHVTLKDIDAGPVFLHRKISGMSPEIVICDAVEQSHLTIIAQAAALAGDRWLLCGSGGLAKELHLFLSKVPDSTQAVSANPLSGPALVVVGTRNQMTANQLLKVKDELGLPTLNLEVEDLTPEDISPRGVAHILEEAGRLLGQGKGLALSSAFSQYVAALKQPLPAIIAEVVAGILESWKIAGLFLSGGDIAMGVCSRLSTSAILVHGEVEPGVPAGELVGGQGQGMRVVTKAGGFGTETAIIKSILYLEKGYLA